MLGDEDLDIFFEDDSVPVIFKLDGVESDPVNGLYNPSTEMVSPHQLEAAVSREEVWCQTAEVSGFTKKHTLLIGSIEFRQFGAPSVQGVFTRYQLVK